MTDTIPVNPVDTQTRVRACEAVLAAAWVATSPTPLPHWLPQLAAALCADPDLLGAPDPSTAHHLLLAALPLARDAHTRALAQQARAEQAWDEFCTDLRSRVATVVDAGHICADGGNQALVDWGVPPLERCYEVSVDIPALLHVEVASEHEAVEAAQQLLREQFGHSPYLELYDLSYSAEICDD